MSLQRAASPAADPRGHCIGLTPLAPRLDPWMRELVSERGRLHELIAEHGSPLNLHQIGAFDRNAAEIADPAQELGIDLGIFFARKANKCIAFVEAAGGLGLGVDVASERELQQTLATGIPPSRIVVTAAIKPAPLLELCLASGVTVVIDNLDELKLTRQLAETAAGPVLPLALRLNPGRLDSQRPRSRFGLSGGELVEAARAVAGDAQLRLVGLQFHLDGYAAADRSATIGEALEFADELSSEGEQLHFIDIGGGFPISYLEERSQWDAFWGQHRAAVAGDREPLTFGAHGLGLRREGERVEGEPAVYPYWQEPTRGEWLRRILTSSTRVHGRAERIVDALRVRKLQLRCEPGRALLDGCGVTAARVEFTKPYEAGMRLIGLAMNRTQCRTSSDDFLVDPLLVPGPRGTEAADRAGGEAAAAAAEGYLVGAYCIERELLSWRRLRFPGGVESGDIVVFPNTAGYFMHILESSSHQLPLARNLILDPSGVTQVDPIDLPAHLR